METVKFTRMKDGDREDYAFLNTHELEFVAGTADRLLHAMVELDKQHCRWQRLPWCSARKHSSPRPENFA